MKYIIFLILFLMFNLVHSSENITCEKIYTSKIDSIEIIQPDYLCLQEEQYVNDIDFSTIDVVKHHFLFLQEEQYVDDIDFDTEYIVKKIIIDKKTYPETT
jgi:hypothetical protein